MDTLGQQVEKNLAVIKGQMPGTYRQIQDWAAQSGSAAYRLVRRGLRGEPNCFWAVEAGYVMGTPFSVTGISDQVAISMVRFGTAHVVVFGPTDEQGAGNGKN